MSSSQQSPLEAAGTYSFGGDLTDRVLVSICTVGECWGFAPSPSSSMRKGRGDLFHPCPDATREAGRDESVPTKHPDGFIKLHHDTLSYRM